LVSYKTATARVLIKVKKMVFKNGFLRISKRITHQTYELFIVHSIQITTFLSNVII